LVHQLEGFVDALEWEHVVHHLGEPDATVQVASDEARELRAAEHRCAALAPVTEAGDAMFREADAKPFGPRHS
jgi:hypothetical protein